MPILRYKHDGVWTEVAGASVHTHTMADVTDLPSSLPADVVELQGLVGDASVAEQIAEAVSTKADIGHEHNNTLLYNTVSGAGAIYIPDALADCPIDISVSSDVYTDFSKLSISFVADNYYDIYSPDSNGTVNGLMSKPSFTLTVTSSIANFDATKVTISCTYQYDLDAVMQNYVLDVDDVLNGETGENDYTNNVTTHTVIDNTLSITGAAADAKKTGDEIKSIKNQITNLGSGYTHLATVATSGDYNDLTNKPTIPSIDGLATETYVNEQIAAIDIPEQAQQVQSDWTETDENSPAYIKHKPTISADGNISTQANWSQTDATQPDFIKNKPFGEENTTETLLEETPYSFTASSALGCYANTIAVMPFVFADGQTYKIVWDSEEYTRTAFSFTHTDGSTCVAVGNPLAAGGESNGDNFAIICDMTRSYVHFCSLETLDSHKVAVYQEITTVTKIDSKYLPDNIGGGSALPEVTTSDAGKFLRVSSLGTWAVESIPNAEEASF